MVAALRQEEDDGHAQQQQVHWEDRDHQVLLFKKIKFKKIIYEITLHVVHHVNQVHQEYRNRHVHQDHLDDRDHQVLPLHHIQKII
jgi:hypothetical protein